MYNRAKFSISAVKLQQLPPDTGSEVAFCGRSNAGKSSAINAITRQNNLAHTSRTPGRTQMINVYTLTDEQRLIDLPGYGYAKASKTMQQSWQKLLSDYLNHRESIKGLILLMDIRHPFKDTDTMLIDWAMQNEVAIHILLTKADKLKRGAAKTALQQTQKALEPYAHLITCQLFSAKTKEGLENVWAKLDEWLAN